MLRFAVVVLASLAFMGGQLSGATPPTIAQAPTSAPTPVTGSTATLTILGASDAGESTLRYVWQALPGSAGDVAFSANGTNGAKTTVASFTAAGSYQIQCTIIDGVGRSVSATVGVSVVQTLTSITMSPYGVSVPVNSTAAFAATGLDQFGAPLTTTPAFTWDFTSPTIASFDGRGVFTTGSTPGIGSLYARVGSLSYANPIHVIAASAPTVTSGPTISANPVTGKSAIVSVTADSPAGEPTLTYWWSAPFVPTNGGCIFAANATNAAKTTTATFTRAGTYVLQVQVHDQQNQVATADVSVTVLPTPAGAIVVTPNPGYAILGQPLRFSAAATDQFGQPITSFAWSVTGAGSIGASTGVFISSQFSVAGTVTASVGSASGAAQVNVGSLEVAAAATGANDPAGDAFPERRSALYVPTTAAPPDITVVEPGRVMTALAAGPGIPAVYAPNGTRFSAGRGSSVTLAVQAAPGAPVTFASLDGGAFPNGLPAANVVADADGAASAVFTTPQRIGDCRVLVGSGATSGQVVFRGRIQ